MANQKNGNKSKGGKGHGNGGKGGNGGQNASSPEKRNADAEAGRARKRAERKQRAAARDAERAAAIEKVAAEHAKAVASAGAIGLLVDGIPGATVAIPFGDGTVVAEIFRQEGQRDPLEAVKIVSSDVAEYPVCDIYVAHVALFRKEPPSWSNATDAFRRKAQSIWAFLAGAIRSELKHRREVMHTVAEAAKAEVVRIVQVGNDPRDLFHGPEGTMVETKLTKFGDDGKAVESGTVTFGVIFKNGKRCVRIAESNLKCLSVVPGDFVGIGSLFHEHEPNFGAIAKETKAARLGEMWRALRYVCQDAIAERIARREAEADADHHREMAEAAPAAVQSVSTVVEPARDLETARKLSGVHLAEHPTRWGKRTLLVHTDASGAAAYFERRLEAGARKLMLIAVEAGHALEALLEEHREVKIDFAEFLTGDRAEVGDLHDIREARKHAANYVRAELPRIGYRPKGQKPTTEVVVTTEVTTSPEDSGEVVPKAG